MSKKFQNIFKMRKTKNLPTLKEQGLLTSKNGIGKISDSLMTIHPVIKINDDTYGIEKTPLGVSTTLKMVIDTPVTDDLPATWTNIIWEAIQTPDVFEKDVYMTVTRRFEIRDKANIKSELDNRRRITISGSSEANRYLGFLLDYINRGNRVISFGAQINISAPDEIKLHNAVEAYKKYIEQNNIIKGLSFQIDVSYQRYPYTTYGLERGLGNHHLTANLTTQDATIASLIVNRGGYRKPGAEYIGRSEGNYIDSYAAYSFVNSTSLFIGNRKEKKTYTLQQAQNLYKAGLAIPSQLYMSNIASRAYLLNGKKVTHIVLSDNITDHLMRFPIRDEKKVYIDVTEGLLNMMQPTSISLEGKSQSWIKTAFNNHLDNIIILLNQFRDDLEDKTNVTDDYAIVIKSLLREFFVAKRYWFNRINERIDRVRIFDVKHEDFLTLSDFGRTLSLAVESSFTEDPKGSLPKTKALRDLERLVNALIIPTSPVLNTTTDPIIDDMLASNYRVLDFSGLFVGRNINGDSPLNNTLLLMYINLIIKNIKKGDVVMIHGGSRASTIIGQIHQMIDNLTEPIDVIYTEDSQKDSLKLLNQISPESNGRRNLPKFIMVDLYNNDVSDLVDVLNMSENWNNSRKGSPNKFFIRYDTADAGGSGIQTSKPYGIDYIELDYIFNLDQSYINTLNKELGG